MWMLDRKPVTQCLSDGGWSRVRGKWAFLTWRVCFSKAESFSMAAWMSVCVNVN
jgi:hypothetical protein